MRGRGGMNHVGYYINKSTNIVAYVSDDADTMNEMDRRIRGNLLVKLNDEDLDEYLEKERECFFCGEKFRELNNLGTLQCKVHYGVPSLMFSENKMTCCKIEPLDLHMILNGIKFDSKYKNFIKGCVPTDHNHLPYKYSQFDDIKVKRAFSGKYLSIIGLDLEFSINCRRSEDEEDTIFLRRYDEMTLRALEKYSPFENGNKNPFPTEYKDKQIKGFILPYQNEFKFFQKEIELEEASAKQRLLGLKEDVFDWDRDNEIVRGGKKDFFENDIIEGKYFRNNAFDFEEKVAKNKILKRLRKDFSLNNSNDDDDENNNNNNNNNNNDNNSNDNDGKKDIDDFSSSSPSYTDSFDDYGLPKRKGKYNNLDEENIRDILSQFDKNKKRTNNKNNKNNKNDKKGEEEEEKFPGGNFSSENFFSENFSSENF